MLEEIVVVALLIAANGVFSLAELAVVAAPKGVLQEAADSGSRGARAALRLAERPGRFLSTVQLGITLVGVLAGAYSGATFAGPLGAALSDNGVPYAEEAAFALVVAVITYVSIVAGELIPKQLALRGAARAASAIAIPMEALSRMALPFVALLDLSAAVGLRLLGRSRVPEEAASEEEVRRLVAEGTRAGVFSPDEGRMMDRVMSLADRGVRTVMTARIDVEWLDVEAPIAESLAELRRAGHSRLPLCRGRVDDVVGVVRARDVLDRMLDGAAVDLAALALPVAFVPESASALEALEVLKAGPAHLAIVVDEHGAFDGLVTDADLLEAVAGAMREAEGPSDLPDAVMRPDGSWLVDGDMDLDGVRRRLRLPSPPEGPYQTLAGFVLDLLGHVPAAGERVEWHGWTFEVADMDGHRIDKLLVAPPPNGPAGSPGPAST
ncbi:MAG: HlyC/CorC family transporter [Deltaproteobacteria bacterium]|nr:HlyC/CorC family transporter [Deltaproteobacteria bacterium]